MLDDKQTFGLSRYSIPAILLVFILQRKLLMSSYVTQRSGIRAHEGNSWAPLVVTVCVWSYNLTFYS